DEIGQAHADIQWPADGLVTPSRTTALSRLQPGSSPSTILTNTSAFAPGNFTPTGAARTPKGARLLVADASLGELAGDLLSPTDAALASQRRVAESSVLRGERPGTPRSLLVVPDRASLPSPEGYAQLRSTVEEIPWLQRGNFTDMLAEVPTAPKTAVPRTA